MDVKLHANATVTPKIRAHIRASQGSAAELAAVKTYASAGARGARRPLPRRAGISPLSQPSRRDSASA